MSLSEKFAILANIRTSIREKLVDKGIEASNHDFINFASDIESIETGITPTGSIEITENGTYDVTNKAEAVVDVSGGGVPQDFFALVTAVNGSPLIAPLVLDGVETLRLAAVKNVRGCPKITLPSTVTMLSENFHNCVELKEAYLPSLTQLTEAYCFNNCANLQKVDFGALTTFAGNNYRFSSVKDLETIIIRTNSVCALTYKLVHATKYVNGTGFFYVPRNLVDAYKVASNWSDYADTNQIRAIEDYPDITGG